MEHENEILEKELEDRNAWKMRWRRIRRYGINWNRIRKSLQEEEVPGCD